MANGINLGGVISGGAPPPLLPQQAPQGAAFGGLATSQTPPVPQAPRPPASPQEEAELEQGWIAFFNNPEVQTALLQFALNVAQPVPAGQSTVGHIARAVGAGGEAIQRGRDRRIGEGVLEAEQGRLAAGERREVAGEGREVQEFKRDISPANASEIAEAMAEVERLKASGDITGAEQLLRNIGERFGKSPEQLEAEAKAERVGPGTGAFGASLPGSALDIVTNLGPGFGNGTLSPTDENFFRSAAHEITTGRSSTQTDPETGRLITIRIPGKPLPPQVAQEFVKRGEPVPLPTGGGSGVEEAETEIPGTFEVQQMTVAAMNEAGSVTGPMAALGRFAASIPFLGGLTVTETTAPQVAALVEVKNKVRRTAVALQNNPRYPIGEFERILETVGFGPSLVDNKENFLQGLVALDNALAGEQADAARERTAHQGNPIRRRTEAETERAIAQLRNELVPQIRVDLDTMTDEEVLQALSIHPAGTAILVKENNVWTLDVISERP